VRVPSFEERGAPGGGAGGHVARILGRSRSLTYLVTGRRVKCLPDEALKDVIEEL
jgi:enoyl-CoA hydratase/carnithine racemase